MRKKKKEHDPPAAPSPPAMFVGDEDPAARVPEPPPAWHLFLIPPPEVLSSRLRAFFTLPPDPSEKPPPAQPASDADESTSGIHDVTGERPPILVGCLTLFALVLVSSAVETILDLSFAQEMAGFAVLGAIALAVRLWWTLDDFDVAVADRDSRRLIARLRRWLRRVLRIRVG